MSLAKVKYPFAKSDIAVGFSASDVTTEVVGDDFDRFAGGKPNAVLAVIAGTLTTATGAAGDNVEFTVNLDTGDAASPTTNLVSKTVTVATNADNNQKDFAIMVEFPLHDADKYCNVGVTAAMEAGATGTLSTCSATLAYILGSLTDGAVQQVDTAAGASDAAAT